MSRTIRRKNTKYPYLRYTREEFDEQRAVYESGEWRGEGRYFNYHTGEWITYLKKWWDRPVAAHASYDAYVAAKEAKHQSDCGHAILRTSAPKHFRKSLERVFRAKHKHSLTAAIVAGKEEDLMLQPFIRDAAWHWW